MTKTIIGYEEHEFEYEGKKYPMVKLYAVHPISNGLKPSKEIYCKKSVIDDFEHILNAEVEISYNEWGKVSRVHVF